MLLGIPSRTGCPREGVACTRRWNIVSIVAVEERVPPRVEAEGRTRNGRARQNPLVLCINPHATVLWKLTRLVSPGKS